MKTCENCSSLNDGNYGSGRFCSSKCARGFSTKKKRKEINEKVRENLKGKFKGIISKTGEPSHQNVENICKCCDKKFLISWAKRKQQFCSMSCNSSVNGWSNPNINWSEVHKKAYRDGRNYVAGGLTKWFEVETSIGKIKVQGTYELRVCKILDNWKINNKIKNWEYTSDKIEYIGFDNKPHSYLIDFKVFNLDGSFWYIEVKGYLHDNDKLKWKAVRDKRLKLEVWFKKDIEEKEKINGLMV